VGGPFTKDAVTELPARPLTTSKILRDRGIKVITATLPELRPSNPAVRQQLVDYWRAQWQKERDVNLAAYDYQEMRVRASARVQAQNSIVKSLTEILADDSITREMAALRLLQSIEAYAHEPMTEKLVPLETVRTISFLMQKVGGGEGYQQLPEKGSGSDV
jgi:hypothetical protein